MSFCWLISTFFLACTSFLESYFFLFDFLFHRFHIFVLVFLLLLLHQRFQHSSFSVYQAFCFVLLFTYIHLILSLLRSYFLITYYTSNTNFNALTSCFVLSSSTISKYTTPYFFIFRIFTYYMSTYSFSSYCLHYFFTINYTYSFRLFQSYILLFPYILTLFFHHIQSLLSSYLLYL